MPYLEIDISKTKMKQLVQEFVTEELSEDELEKFCYKYLRELELCEFVDWTRINKLAVKKMAEQEEYE